MNAAKLTPVLNVGEFLGTLDADRFLRALTADRFLRALTADRFLRALNAGKRSSILSVRDFLNGPALNADRFLGSGKLLGTCVPVGLGLLAEAVFFAV